MKKPYTFTCPTTSLSVQGHWDERAQPADNRWRIELVHCPACGRPHFVDPKSGRLLSDTARPTRLQRAAAPL